MAYSGFNPALHKSAVVLADKLKLLDCFFFSRNKTKTNILETQTHTFSQKFNTNCHHVPQPKDLQLLPKKNLKNYTEWINKLPENATKITLQLKKVFCSPNVLLRDRSFKDRQPERENDLTMVINFPVPTQWNGHFLLSEGIPSRETGHIKKAKIKKST